MQKVLILKGLPGSGKTTYALELMKKEPGKWKRINKDTIRLMVDGGEFSRKNEKVVLDARDSLLKEFLKSGYDVIVDDTNFISKHKTQIEWVVAQYMDQSGGMVEIEEKLIDTPLEECVARDAKRTGREHVGEKVIRDMHARYFEQKKSYDNTATVAYKHLDDMMSASLSQFLPVAVICDLDGTLAHMNGRSPFDWGLVGTDHLNQNIAAIVRLLAIGHRMILVSGRDEVCRKETMEWLDKHNIPYKDLIMRKHNDNRSDNEVKLEMFDNHIRGKYNVLAVLDDRNKVVAMWRKLGLTCLQVAEGNF